MSSVKVPVAFRPVLFNCRTPHTRCFQKRSKESKKKRRKKKKNYQLLFATVTHQH